MCSHDRPVLRLGIRYGFVAVMLSFGIGILMSITSGRSIGDAGDLLLAHALGVHGIQALPAVALVLVSFTAVHRAAGWVHLAGVGWLTASVAALGQALMGRPPLEVSPLTGLMVTGCVAWVAAGICPLLMMSAEAHTPRRVENLGVATLTVELMQVWDSEQDL